MGSRTIAVSLEMLVSRPMIGSRRALVLLALVASACAPSVPQLADPPGDAAAVVSITSSEATAVQVETTAVPQRVAGNSSTTVPSTTATLPPTTTTTTMLADAAPILSVGPWTLAATTRDEGGADFDASVTVPTLSGDVDPVLRGRIATSIDGQVESQIGSTLALWRAIEAQGSRDINGSTLQFEFDVAAFEEGFIALRFFSEERIGGSAGVKRQATTLMIDLRTGGSIGFDDIIAAGESSREALLALVLAGLLDDYFGGDTEAFSPWAHDLTTAHLDQVVLAPEGLEVWFDELEVGPRDLGMPVVTITYADLGGIVDPAGPAALFGG
jgi:hypothetical protein